MFGNYNFRQTIIQGQRAAFAFYNLTLPKMFLNKKLNLGLRATDPFNNYISQNSINYISNFHETRIRDVAYRSFGISFNYKFGKLEFKKSEKIRIRRTTVILSIMI
jgi:ferric enterobactin receptor